MNFRPGEWWGCGISAGLGRSSSPSLSTFGCDHRAAWLPFYKLRVTRESGSHDAGIWFPRRGDLVPTTRGSGSQDGGVLVLETVNC